MGQQTGYCIEDIEVGMSESIEKTIGEAEVQSFADLTGDNNPVHLDEEYAKGTMFKTRIAHGMLTGSLISAVLGTRLPGTGAIYLSQNCRFRAPVRLGSTVTTSATVTAVDKERRQVTLETKCVVNGKTVLDGEARVMVPSREQA